MTSGEGKSLVRRTVPASALSLLLLLAGFTAFVPPAEARAPWDCSNRYIETEDACVFDDGECSFIVVVGHDPDTGDYVWHVGPREAMLYGRPGNCDNYGVASCDGSACIFVAFLGTGRDGKGFPVNLSYWQGQSIWSWGLDQVPCWKPCL